MRICSVDTYRALLDRFASLLKQQYGDRLVSVVLYGSVARGTARATSDLDLLLIIQGLPDPYGERIDGLVPVLMTLRKQPEYVALVAEGLLPSPSVVMLTPEEASHNRLLYLDMIEEGIRLIDKGDFFKRRLDTLRARLEELGAVRSRQNDDWYWDLKPDHRLGEALAL